MAYSVGAISAQATVYKDHLFRSRLEARWAVFFDTLKIAWAYEQTPPTTYSRGLYYRPDFWLPDYTLWLEVKGAASTYDAEAKEKAARLMRLTHQPVYVFVGDFYGGQFPVGWRHGGHPNGAVETKGWEWGECTDPGCGALVFHHPRFGLVEGHHNSLRHFMHSPRLIAAFEAARSMHFEGQK